LNASYPSFISENANRAFPFIFNPLNSEIENHWFLGFKGFSRKSILENPNLYKIFVYPEETSFEDWPSNLISDENINYKNLNFLEAGYISLFFEVHKGPSLIDRTIVIKVPIGVDQVYTAVASESSNTSKVYEFRALISEKFFQEVGVESFKSIESTLFLEHSLVLSVGDLVIDSLNVIDPNNIQQTDNLIVAGADYQPINGKYIFSETENQKNKYYGPNDFQLSWDTNNQWVIKKRSIPSDIFYFSDSNAQTPDAAVNWQNGPSAATGAIPSVSRENINPKRSVYSDVKFYSGINTEVSQIDDEIQIISELDYGLGQAVYKGNDAGVCNGILSINGLRPNEARSFFLRGSNGILVEDDPINHRIVVKVDPRSKVAKCPPFIKVIDANLTTEVPNPLTPDYVLYYANFEIIISSQWVTPIVVNYVTVNGTAFSGIHFEPTQGSLIFEPGERSKTVKVLMYFENFDPGEALNFNLDISSTSGVAISRPTAEASFSKPVTLF
jgi:hypothetical protein